MKPLVHCTYAALQSMKAGEYVSSYGNLYTVCGVELENKTINDPTDFSSLNNKFFFEKELFYKRPMVTCPECIKIIKEAGF